MCSNASIENRIGAGVPRSQGEWRPAALSLMVAACLVSMPVASDAQDPRHPVQHDQVSQHHRVQYLLMKQMSDEMARMNEEMAQDNITPEQRKQMARQMGRMSILMRRMSALWSRPAMSEARMQAEMEKMQREMEAMTKNERMRPVTK